MRGGCIVGERHAYDNKLAFAILRRLDRRAELGATLRTPPAHRIPDPVPAVSGDWQLLLNALHDDRKEDATLLLTPIPPEIDEVDNPSVEGVEGDDLDDEPYVEKRVWQEFKSGDWRTNFPPPPGFVGNFRSSWEKHDYSRALTAAELDAFTSDGSDNDIVTLEQDEADRDAFFAAFTPTAPPPAQGEVSVPTDGGGTKPQKPRKSEPPSTPDRSQRGASSPGENS